jgi:hypothetical protein
MVRMPGDIPGCTVAPEFATFPVIMPMPESVPPLNVSVVVVERLPPFSVVLPAD